MPLALANWSPTGANATIFDMKVSGAWDELSADYAYMPKGNAPLRRIFEIAQAHGVTTIVKEPRYIDADWRSQLAHFYNGNFRRFPSVCHRLHFFAGSVPADLEDLGALQEFYRGYTVLRPLPISPVGRTMLMAPPEMDDAVRCESIEEVDLFGWPLHIRAMPFISQDTQYHRCAHAAIWMVLRHAHLTHGLPKRLPSDIHEAATGGVMTGRQLPSDGVSAYQMMCAMTVLGLSPAQKPLAGTPEENEAAGLLRLHAMICRYVNSSLPPIVISDTHAWVIAGYARRGSTEDPRIHLWRHDDAAGPYIEVPDPWNEAEEAHRPWLSVYLPLLPKAFVDAERAELVGKNFVKQFTNSGLVEGTTFATAEARGDEFEGPTYRTYLVPSTRFKRDLTRRGVPERLAAAVRLSPMPRFVWVIEVVDRRLRNEGEPDVLGEVVLDATLTQFEPLNDPASVLLFHVDDVALLTGVDQAPALRLSLPRGVIYRTGSPVLQNFEARQASSGGAAQSTNQG
jgi:hypothetical protein